MKQLIGIWICYLIVIGQLAAQNTAPSNAWIDYSKTYHKIKVGKEGIYRVPKATLQAAGLPLVGAQFVLLNKGREVPLYVTNNGDLADGDYIEFYGVPNDGEVDLPLYQQAFHQPNPNICLFSDTASYFLTTDLAANHLRYTLTDNNLQNLPPKEEFFWYKAHNNYPETFCPGKVTFVSGTSIGFADFEEGEGFLSEVIDENQSLTFNLKTPAIYPLPNANITFATQLAGQSRELSLPLADHHVEIAINNIAQADTTYKGYTLLPLTLSFPLSTLNLSDDTTYVKFTSLNDLDPTPTPEDPSVDKNKVAYVSITYPRSFDFDGVRKLRFSLANNSNKYVEIVNFSGGSAPILYDLTNRLRLVPVVESGVYKFFLPQIGDEATRELYLTNTTTLTGPLQTIKELTANDLKAINFIDYSQQQGDYLLVYHPILEQGTVNEVQRYADYRASAAGGSHSVVRVNIEQLYDQYAWGVAKHPLAIVNFLQQANSQWTTTPTAMLLLGKAVEYEQRRLPTAYHKCLVPTYGSISSDAMFARQTLYVYNVLLSVGRVPAQTANDVKAYLDKVIEYENREVLACTPQARGWTKHGLHIAGGNNLSESQQFLNFLSKYESIYESPQMGGQIVHTYNKLSEDVIENQDYLDQFINDGVSIIAFFGHSGPQNLSVDIKQPTAYTNQGKYPLFITGSCSVGNIHIYNSSQPNGHGSLSETFTLANGLGSIGFLATASIGQPYYLDRYLERVYANLSNNTYTQPVGKALSSAINSLFFAYPNDSGTKFAAQAYTFCGDPALQFNHWEKTEFYLTPNNVSTETSQIIADAETFNLKVILANLGRALPDSVTLRIARQLPDGTLIANAFSQRLLIPTYSDTLTLAIPIGDSVSAAGENIFTITIDPDNEYSEYCEDNNQVVKSIFILSNLLIPIYPCNYAIVSNPDVQLTASTGQPLITPLMYTFQLDTTTLFNSPLLQEHTMSSGGGVLAWQPNSAAFLPNTVYYWRASSVPQNTQEEYRWKSASFIYRPQDNAGFNQSHYYQWQANTYSDMVLNPNRSFDFEQDTRRLYVNNDYDNPIQSISVQLDEALLKESTCLKNECLGGITIMVFKPEGQQLVPLLSERNPATGFGCTGVGSYGNVHCNSQPTAAIEFATANADQQTALLNFIQNHVKPGEYVLLYNVSNPHLESFQPELTAVFNQLLQDMGFSEAQIQSLYANKIFVFFGRKGELGYTPQLAVANNDNLLELNPEVLRRSDRGSMATVPVGPALQWGSLHYALSQYDNPAQRAQLTVYGGATAGSMSTTPLLDLNLSSPTDDIDLSSINATTYPFLQAKFTFADTLYNACPDVDYCRLYFTRAPEAALNLQQTFNFYADTLQEGEEVQLQFALTNPEIASMDSVTVQYTIIDRNNMPHIISYPKQAPLGGGETIVTNFSHSTTGFPGNNILSVLVNPNNNQPEKFDFNNVLNLPFFVKRDDLNPYIDIVIDGRHILDGEIVSAQPIIAATITDENVHLPLNDTTQIAIYLTYPADNNGNSAVQRLYFNNPLVQFVPAQQQQAAEHHNKATITLQPQFTQSGTYHLAITAKDRSNNSFAERSYRISFKVETRPMVSNVYNYPNPFTTSTRFLFTLTGSEIPEVFTLQIMTISGKVVREVSRAELGNLHIGQNLTEWAWDGTDQFGNALANGVYLYRLIANLNGKKLDNMALPAGDNLFKNGIGKMYLMR